MRTPSTLAALAATFVALFPGCNRNDTPAVPSAPATIAAPPRLPELTEPPSPPQRWPVLLKAQLNGGTDATVSAGWPVMIEAALRLRAGAAQNLTLANPAGAWSDALRLSCIGPDGTDRAALFRRVDSGAASLALAPGRYGVAAWVLGSLDLATLPAGKHRIRIALDAAKLGDAVPAGLVAEDVDLTVEPNVAQTPRSGQELCLLRMSVELLQRAPGRRWRRATLGSRRNRRMCPYG